MQPLAIEGMAMWSVWQPDRSVYFNSFFLRRDAGNIVVDPLAWTPDDEAQMRERGGVAWIIVTNRDHERRSRDLAAAFGAKLAASERDAPLLSGPVDRTLREGDDAFDGIAIIEFEGLKSPGEIALHMKRDSAAIVGDALWGDPAGSVRLLPDAKLLDPKKAVLSLRKLWALELDTLLVGDGACIFHGADSVIGAYLEGRTDVYVNRINLDETPTRQFVETSERGTRYTCTANEIGAYIGARKLGYWTTTLPPGSRFCPMHSHSLEEEMFYVLDGTPTIRTPRGEFECRRGDFIAFPVGDRGAHQVLNASDKPCTVLLLSRRERVEVCHYPDSNKVMIDASDSDILNGLILRAAPALEYLDGE